MDVTLTERTIYRLSQAKKIPAFKVGGMWRYSQTDIDSWIKRQTSVTPGDDGSSTPGEKS